MINTIQNIIVIAFLVVCIAVFCNFPVQDTVGLTLVVICIVCVRDIYKSLK